ncbi:MAG: hypothetical protein GY765_24580 [bacterium]|nr:hypothetical protein [bacterium]
MLQIVHIVIEIAVFVLVILFFLKTLKKLGERMERLEERVHYLTTVSKYFPEFIQKGESITKNISEDLLMKQNVLRKLISEADKASDKLGYVEDKIKDKKLDKSTMTKVLILVNQGFTPKEIAPRLNIPVGEIELMVKLKKYLNQPIKEKL